MTRGHVAVLAMCSVALVGCTSHIAGTASPGPNATRPEPTLSPTERDAEWFAYVSRHRYYDTSADPDSWVAAANAVCGAFDRVTDRSPYDEIVDVMYGNFDPITRGEAEDFVRTAVGYYCPEHEDDLP